MKNKSELWWSMLEALAKKDDETAWRMTDDMVAESWTNPDRYPRGAHEALMLIREGLEARLSVVDPCHCGGEEGPLRLSCPQHGGL